MIFALHRMTDEWSLLQIELVKQRRTSKHSKTPAGNKPTAKNLSPSKETEF